MTHANFNIDEFTSSLTSQVKDVIPNDTTQETVDYIINTMDSFLHLAYEALCHDDELDLSDDQYSFLLQVLAEWIFHKSIDLSRAKVPFDLWDSVMQKIAFTIFEIVKESFKKEVSQDDIVNIIESHVNNAYKYSLQELLDKKRITKDIFETALSESNIDKMAEEYRSIEQENIIDETPKSTIKKKQKNPIQINKIWQYCKQFVLYLASFAVFILLSAGIWNYRLQIMSYITTHKELIISCTIGIVVLFALIRLVIYFTAKKRVEQQLKELDNIHKQMQDLVNPDKQFERLGVDTLCLEVGAGLLCIADVDQDGLLLAKTAALRQELTDELGYIIPNIRVIDSSHLDNYEYKIFVREQPVASGYVYPEKLMVLAEEWDKKVGEIPENATFDVEPTWGAHCYWLNKKDTEKYPIIKVLTPENVIKQHLKEILISNVDYIIRSCDIEKYIERARQEKNSEELLKHIKERLELETIRKVFVNLIREKVSIKDIIFVFDRLSDYSKTIKNPYILSEMLRVDMALHISTKYADKFKNIYVVEFDEKCTKYLESNVQDTANGQNFTLQKEQINDLIEIITTKLLSAKQIIKQEAQEPIILCSPKFRQALYKIMVRYIPHVKIISYNEVIPQFRTDTLETIELADIKS